MSNKKIENMRKPKISFVLKIALISAILIIAVFASMFLLWHPLRTEKRYYYSININPENETENYTIYVPLPVDSEGKPLKENKQILLKKGSAVFSEVFRDKSWLLKIEGRGDAHLEANTSWNSIKISRAGLGAALSTLNKTEEPYFNKTVYKYTVISDYVGKIHLELEFHVELTRYSSADFPVDGCMLCSKVNGDVFYGENELRGTYENRCISFP